MSSPQPSIVHYELPANWIRYDPAAILGELVNAKAAVLSLTHMPFQRSWAEKLQAMELKREVAGTSKIEGADFTDKELDEALLDGPPKGELTRSQRQARAAIKTYRWIATVPSDRRIDADMIKQIHASIVTGCDDDHCGPGKLRSDMQNVVFGRPRHRGVEGGQTCEAALNRLVNAMNQEFQSHDPIVQALAVHYHFGAMHPFEDGNGRTARALEGLMLRQAHLKDALFIAMSNYYYDEKDRYLTALAQVRANNHDLTPFLKFGLQGVASQCQRMLKEIRFHVEKSLFRDVMGQMYQRLESTKKRALAKRELAILTKLLDLDQPIEYRELYTSLMKEYSGLKTPAAAYVRDLNHLSSLLAISVREEQERYHISVRLEWATEITETEFFQRMHKLPEAKTRLIVSG